MTRYISTLFSVVFLTFLLGCSTESSQSSAQETTVQKEIVVFGSNQCSHCLDFKSKLDSAGLTYTFHDIDVDDQRAEEMIERLQAINFEGRVSLPVIMVNNQRMYVAPDFADIAKAVVQP
ncbi:MAG: glutaredoxin [Paraglaciecola sp.]|jgi:glutaredoxin